MKDIRQVVFFLLQVILCAGDTQGPVIQTPDQIYLDVRGYSLVCQPLPSCCKFCAIVKDRVWSDSMEFCDLCWNVGRTIRLQEQVFVVYEPL